MYVAAYVVWFILATIIFYVIFVITKPSFLMDKKDHHHGTKGHHDDNHDDGQFNVGKAIGLSLLIALFTLVILQLILWAVGW